MCQKGFVAEQIHKLVRLYVVQEDKQHHSAIIDEIGNM